MEAFHPGRYFHALADGRDVDPVSFERYIERLEEVLAEVNGDGADARIASGGAVEMPAKWPEVFELADAVIVMQAKGWADEN